MFDKFKKKAAKILPKKKPEKKTANKKKAKPKPKPEPIQEQIQKQSGITTATAGVERETHIQSAAPHGTPPVPVVKPKISLTIEMIKKYINSNVNDSEAFMFLQLCKSQNLNPFIREAYLIKYSPNQNDPATMVVGKDVFTKRANHNPLYDGMKAGIILVYMKDGNEVKEYREGSDYLVEKEKLIGGWVDVFRKDRRIPLRVSVSFDEYVGKKKNGEIKYNWKKMPATMIRKVAVVQGLRESFPDDFQGLYDESEMGIDLKSDAPEQMEPIKVGESKPDPKPPLKPVASSKAEEKPKEKKKEEPKQDPHPESREGLIKSILVLCKQNNCKTVTDAQGLTGYDKIEDPTIPLKDLKDLKKELEVKLTADKKTKEEPRKVKGEDIE